MSYQIRYTSNRHEYFYYVYWIGGRAVSLYCASGQLARDMARLSDHVQRLKAYAREVTRPEREARKREATARRVRAWRARKKAEANALRATQTVNINNIS